MLFEGKFPRMKHIDGVSLGEISLLVLAIYALHNFCIDTGNGDIVGVFAEQEQNVLV